MNNRFKFRIYDGKKIHYDDFVVTATGYIASIDDYDGEYCFFDQSDFTADREYKLMQCTGLKDKNGKLIYEGDILKTIGNREATGCGVVEYLQSGCRFYVNGYLDNPSPYHLRKKGELYNPLQEWLCKEVIGNIYENPELLGGNNNVNV